MNAEIYPRISDESRLPVLAEAGFPLRPGYGYPNNVEPGADALQSRGRIILLHVLDLIVKYKFLIAGIFIAALMAGYLQTAMTTPMYEAATTIQIDVEAPRVLNKRNGGDNDITMREPFFFETQYQLLKSRSLAERVANSLDLAAVPNLAKTERTSVWSRFLGLFWTQSPGKRDTPPLTAATIASAREAAVGQIMGGLSVQPVPMSRIVRIAYMGPSAALAQKISIAVAENFVASTLDRKYSASTYARDFIQERLQQLKAKIEDSEKQVVAYARKEGIVNIDEKEPETSTRLSALNAALSAATTDRIKTEELWHQAEAGNGLGLPQVLSNHSVETAREKRAQLMADYKEKLNILKPAFPEMIQLKSQITELDRQIKDQVDLVKESIRAQFDAAKAQQDSLENAVRDLRSQSLDLRSRSIEYNILKRELDTNKSLYDGLLQQYKELGVTSTVGTNNISIVDRAEMPGGPSSPRLSRNLLFAVIVGLGLATGVIYVLELFDDTFKSAETVEESLAITTLGVIPLAERGMDPLDDVVKVPNSAVAEAYRSLRTALQFSTDSGAPRVILVTSAKPGEGKSTTSISLAVNFAQLGMRVILIDTDLRRPSIGQYLKIDNPSGLTNYLSGASDIESVIRRDVFHSVSVVTAGPLPPNPAELLAGTKLPALLAQLANTFDVVVLDGPPVMGLADAPILSSLVAGTLLVVQSASTRRAVVRAAVKRLRFARARIVGVVLSKFDTDRSGYSYRYAYSYSHNYNYSGEKPKLAKPADA